MSCADLGEIVRAKFDFDVVGHYARPEVLSLVVNDKPQLQSLTALQSPNSHQVGHKQLISINKPMKYPV
jgi:hypothetical protein